jgi:hypothetical protein
MEGNTRYFHFFKPKNQDKKLILDLIREGSQQ